jgi:hypothetical protein
LKKLELLRSKITRNYIKIKMLNANMPQASQPKGPNNPRYKTTLCKHYDTPQGCSYGDKCQFAHGRNEIRLNNSQFAPMIKNQNSMLNYKIVKCKNWEKDGTCKYGVHCTFAHGDNELRNKNDNLYQIGPFPVIVPYNYDMNTMGMMMQPNINFGQMPQMMPGNMGQSPLVMGMMMPSNENMQNNNNENHQGNEEEKNENN